MKAKAILIAFVTILLIQCKSTQFDAKPPFNIIDATYNNWVGGQKGVSGIRLVFNFEAQETVTFQKVYFANKEGSLESANKDGKKVLTGHISTSTTSDITIDFDTKKEVKNKLPESTFPFELKENEAVISYLQNGVTKFYKVKNVTKTKTSFYQ